MPLFLYIFIFLLQYIHSYNHSLISFAEALLHILFIHCNLLEYIAVSYLIMLVVPPEVHKAPSCVLKITPGRS
jgi:hypothetical protein